MAAPSIQIRLQGISATFHHERRGDVTAVNNLDLDVSPGEFLTLLGSSGCGKTTTLRMIAGFQKPSSGRILFGGQDVTGLSANQRDIGFVFQNYALFPHLSVFENVAYGLRVKRQGTAQIESGVQAGLQQVGLHGMGDRMINELSGGQQQRVAVARAFAGSPDVVFADEPTGNLDSRSGAELLDLLRRSVHELGQTVVMVTHDPVAAAYADRAVLLADGRVAADLADPTADSVLDQLKRLGG
jgi:ABC-type Fe3+/spermidine/putrescine transport system ATPase subunit